MMEIGVVYRNEIPYHELITLSGTIFQTIKHRIRIPTASVAFLLLMLLTPENGCPQQVPRIKIHGRVLDQSTNRPLQYVNVFLANTTRGAATDSLGYFSIVNVPIGSHELVASMIGYESYIQTLLLAEGLDEELNILLHPAILQAPVLSVEATYPRDWEKLLKRFKKAFLGTTRNANETKILNSEVLNLKLDGEPPILTATADQPLIIENNALGYSITTHLVDFMIRLVNGEVRYTHQSHFEPLPGKDGKEEKNRKKRRQETYKGSLRHFLTALAAERTGKEGFRMFLVTDLSEDQAAVFEHRVEEEQILMPGEREYERILVFPNYLKIIYSKESPSREYLHDMGLINNERRNLVKGQVSWIRLATASATFNTLGLLNDSYAVTTFGYWAWERFADALPTDYIY